LLKNVKNVKKLAKRLSQNWRLCQNVVNFFPKQLFKRKIKNFIRKIWFCNRFFFPILWCSHNSNQPQEELAEFGYRSWRKVENFKHPAVFWWPARTYCLNVAISLKIFNLNKNLWNLGTLAHFYHKNLLIVVTL
jgi:hypothetical protein